MAFSAIQTATQNTGTGNTVVITTSATTQGNLVVVHIRMGSGVETCDTVTDDKGNTYIVSEPVDASSNRCYQAYGVQVIGGVTAITCNFSAGVVSKRCGADEYAGFGVGATNADVFSSSGIGSGSGTDLKVMDFIPSIIGNLVVSTLTTTGDSIWTAGTGYTLYSGGTAQALRSQYKLACGSVETSPATCSISAPWCEISTMFRSKGTKGFYPVQKVTPVNNTANTLSLVLSPTKEDSLVVFYVNMTGQTVTLGTVSDNKGNIYVIEPVLDYPTNYRSYQAYGMQRMGSAGTLTAYFSGTADKRCGADEYAGFNPRVSNADVFDVSAIGTGYGSGTVTSATLAPKDINELIVVSMQADSSPSWTAGTGYSMYGGYNPLSIRTMYKLIGGTNETAPVVESGENGWSKRVTAFGSGPVAAVMDLTSKTW